MGRWLQDPKRKRAWNAAVVLGIIAGAVMVFSHRFELALVGIGLALASLLWSRRALKCRRCGCDVLWWAMRHQPSNRFVSGLVSLERCPCCNEPSS